MRFLITAGPTREYIDSVRFISNASSGKTGYALAATAIKKGHEVTLISSSDLQPPIGVDFIGVESAAEMFKAVKENFQKCDCLIMTAAVADYTPIKKSKTKIKKSKSDLILKLKPTTDILSWAGKQKLKTQIVVGFALEDKNLRKNAEKKLKEKNLDLIIANSPDSIGAEKAAVEIKTPNGKWQKIAKADKAAIAEKIISLLEKF
ncbi:MAG: phosphopantothenoylcysteine decarboxylase [Planctomycetes bacterium]|nr:phosphopantothenoylcysteine decarboxylase [Planctomycetota bacterium]